MGALLGFIFNIHGVLWVSADPVDVKNETQLGTCPQAICFLNFLMWIWGVISILFEKTWPLKSFWGQNWTVLSQVDNMCIKKPSFPIIVFLSLFVFISS